MLLVLCTSDFGFANVFIIAIDFSVAISVSRDSWVHGDSRSLMLLKLSLLINLSGVCSLANDCSVAGNLLFQLNGHLMCNSYYYISF